MITAIDTNVPLGVLDFGAHAAVQANRLLSRDRGFYGRLYPNLKLIDPTKSRS